MNRSTTSALAPFLARAAARSSRSPRIPLSHYRQPALAIFAYNSRLYSTETSQSSNSGSGNFPPPGFNPEQAKKPVKAEEQSLRNQESEAQKIEADSGAAIDKHESPIRVKDAPSESLKTEAAEDATLAELAAEKASADKATGKSVEQKKKEDKKLTLWQKVKKEVAHYRDGTKLLVTEVKISSKLALKMASGYELTRREHRQVCHCPGSVLIEHRLTR